MERLKKCPFCNSDNKDGWTWFTHLRKPSHPDMKVSIMHYCHPNETEGVHTTITVYGATEEECVKRWNSRGE